MQIRCINNGYWNLKGENDTLVRTRIQIAPYSDYITPSDVLTYNGVTYVVGEGKPLLELDKTQHGDYFTVTILSMLCKYMPTNKSKETFKVILSAPPLAYFTEEINDSMTKALIGKHVVTFNGNTPFEITIDEVTILPETFVAFNSVNSDGEYNNGTVYIIDIGGYTSNVVRIRNQNFTDEDYITLEHGMYHLDTQIANFFRKRFIKEGLRCDYEDVEEFRRNGLYFDKDETNTNWYKAEIDEIEKIANKFLADIDLECKIKNWNLKAGSCKVVIVGGGGEALFEVIQKNFYKKAKLSKTAIWDNLNGLQLMKNILFEE